MSQVECVSLSLRTWLGVDTDYVYRHVGNCNGAKFLVRLICLHAPLLPQRLIPAISMDKAM